ncbi:hypothetical protein [Planctomycetes bacterium Poly30]
MWEFEGLTEMAVILISQSDLEAAERREFFANLYTLQDRFDCSFTHFRQHQVLEDAQFFFRMDVEQHPDHSANEGYFRALVAKGQDSWITLPSDEGMSSAFYCAGKGRDPRFAQREGIYFDVRSDLWRKCCAEGFLEGLAAESFESWSPPELLGRLLEVALQQPESSLRSSVIKGYHGWAAVAIPEMLRPEVRSNERLQRIRELPELRQILAAPAPEDWIDERLLPTTEAFEYLGPQEADVLRWWLEPYQP